MSFLYKNKKDITTSVDMQMKDGVLNLLFHSDCGKHGTDEILDEYDLTPLQLLEILQRLDN